MREGGGNEEREEEGGGRFAEIGRERRDGGFAKRQGGGEWRVCRSG